MSTDSSVPADPPVAPAGDEPDYTAEVRFGVVMYGGVSLAIYINGVTNEIYEMACATPREGVTIADPVVAGAARGVTSRAVYRRLSWLIGNAKLKETYAKRIRAAHDAADRTGGDWADSWLDDEVRAEVASATRTRFAVDVVAGTSAGGINGLFLAKALANGEQFAPLKDMWINEGDFALLINDKQSWQGLDSLRPKDDDQPASLLNSDRMFAKLHEALGRMAAIEGVDNPHDMSPLAEEVDLFMTTTDVRGSPVPLRLFDKVVYERRYKQNYHFSYPNGITNDGNDFAADNTAFLAFAARCTSSFPFAFEPMTLAAVTRLGADSPEGVRRFDGFFPHLSQDEVARGGHVHRAFGDGGYLDNKPFTYVTEALSMRFAAVPIDRKLIFVEPAPEHLDPDSPNARPDANDEPDAIENALAALTTIPQYETIREDLQAILVRNRRIERIERVVELGEEAIRATEAFRIAPDARREVPAWATLGLKDMVAYYGSAYLSYQRLRIYATTDTLADRVGAQLRIDPESDRQYALRGLVRAWRDRHYGDEPAPGKETVNAFLDEFDFGYRMRRLGFLLRKVDALQRLVRRRRRGPFDAPALAALSLEESNLLQYLPAPFTGLPATLSDAVVTSLAALLREFKLRFYEARRYLLDADRSVTPQPADAKAMAAMRETLDPVLLGLLGHTNATGTPLVDATTDALAAAARTLQEGVYLRARAFLAQDGDGANVEAWIGTRLDRLRVKSSGLARQAAASTSSSPVSEVSSYAMELLGRPRLMFLPDSSGAVPVVQAVSDTRFSQAQRDLLNGPAGHALREFFAYYYLRFDSYDQISFPLYYDTATGEPSTVSVVRISPVDATNLIDEATDAAHRKKLAGTALANFGAFLDRRWRLNDIMWGQLDGAERLIEALLPTTDEVTLVVRHELIERAQRHILTEALVPGGRDELADVVVRALAATEQVLADDESAAYARAQVAFAAAEQAFIQAKSSDPAGANAGAAEAALAVAQTDLDAKRAALYARRRSVMLGQVGERFEQLSRGNGGLAAKMAGVLDSFLAAPELMAFVRQSRRNDPDPDPTTTMQSATRAVTVTGRVLEGITHKRTGTIKTGRWLARFGLVAQGIVAVSIPGTLTTQVWRHAMKLLYAFEVVLLGLALLFGSTDLRTLAVSALATTVALHLLTLIVGDVLRGTRRRWLYASGIAVFAALLFFAAIGLLMVLHQGAEQAMCWSRAPDVAESSLPAEVCRVIHRIAH
jgi:patatin-related protein